MEEQDGALVAIFAETAVADLPGEAFADEVVRQTDRLKRWLTLRRVLTALVLGWLAAPLQDFGLAFAQILVVSLIELPNSLVGQILAPINTVGTLLSIVMLGLRLVQRRIFS